MKDLTGQKFGKLKVLEYSKPTTHSKYKHFWLCECECGNKKEIEDRNLIIRNTKSCGCLHKRRGKNSPFFKGCGDIPMNYYSTIKRGAKGGGKFNRKSKIFNVSIEYLWELFKNQKEKCALSGIFLSFNGTALENKKKYTSQFTASLDRIDSSKGYVEGNVQWVHKDINIMKNDLSTEEFVILCKRVAELH